MGLQKFHTHNGHETAHENGAVAVYGRTNAGPHLALVRHCPISNVPGARKLTAYATGEASSYYTVPAAIRFKGKTVSGHLSFLEEGPIFVAAVS